MPTQHTRAAGPAWTLVQSASSKWRTASQRPSLTQKLRYRTLQRGDAVSLHGAAEAFGPSLASADAHWHWRCEEEGDCHNELLWQLSAKNLELHSSTSSAGSGIAAGHAQASATRSSPSTPPGPDLLTAKAPPARSPDAASKCPWLTRWLLAHVRFHREGASTGGRKQMCGAVHHTPRPPPASESA